MAMGRVERLYSTRAVDRGRERTTRSMGVCACEMVQTRQKNDPTERTVRCSHQCCWRTGPFSRTGITKESWVDADMGRMRSSVLERGEDGADQDAACFAGRWNHCRNLDAKRTSIDGESPGTTTMSCGGGGT